MHAHVMAVRNGDIDDLSAGPAPAFAEEFYFSEFTNVLPSTRPSTNYMTEGPFGPIIIESDAYQVINGTLNQRTMSNQGQSYYESASIPAIDASLPLIIEARLRVLSITTGYSSGFWVFDGTFRYSVVLGFFGARLYHDNGPGYVDIPFSMDEGGAFHTFRLESEAGTSAYSFYRDNVLMFAGTAPADSRDALWQFGDGGWDAVRNADINWDYVRFIQPAPTTPVPALSPFGITALLSLLGLAGIRRLRD